MNRKTRWVAAPAFFHESDVPAATQAAPDSATVPQAVVSRPTHLSAGAPLSVIVDLIVSDSVLPAGTSNAVMSSSPISGAVTADAHAAATFADVKMKSLPALLVRLT